jgi:hypothetical protein
MRRTTAPLEEVAQTVSIDDASLYIDNLSFFL